MGAFDNIYMPLEQQQHDLECCLMPSWVHHLCTIIASKQLFPMRFPVWFKEGISGLFSVRAALYIVQIFVGRKK